MELIDIIKSKLPDPKPSDEMITVHIEEVGQAIMTYCNRDDIPTELRFVHANMVVDLINGEAKKANSEANQSVQSIKEGDVQVTFANTKLSASESATESILSNYQSQLNRFRKLRW